MFPTCVLIIITDNITVYILKPNDPKSKKQRTIGRVKKLKTAEIPDVLVIIYPPPTKKYRYIQQMD